MNRARKPANRGDRQEPRSPGDRSHTIVVRIAALLALIGVLLLGWAVWLDVVSSRDRQRDVEAFHGARASFSVRQAAGSPVNVPHPVQARSGPATPPGHADPAAKPVPGRAGPAGNLPEGILRIPAVGIEVPVYAGTQERNLLRGAGRVEQTPRLGTTGNVAVAAHRDRAFSGLRNISEGDAVFVDSLDQTLRYEVIWIRIVDPGDTWVLAASREPHLTLITCYPFDFIGLAPRRFIVRAKLSAQPAG